MRFLILCTGNSCRSQMAEGFLKNFDKNFEVFSAGTKPEKEVNPFAVEVMEEIGISMENTKPENVENFVNQSFDYVITVCGNAKEICPIFTGNVKNRIHIGFEDPAEAKGEKEEVIKIYQEIRDQIKEQFLLFYNKIKTCSI